MMWRRDKRRILRKGQANKRKNKRSHSHRLKRRKRIIALRKSQRHWPSPRITRNKSLHKKRKSQKMRNLLLNKVMIVKRRSRNCKSRKLVKKR